MNPLEAGFSLPDIEEEVLKFWSDNQIFQKSVSKDHNKKDYFFYDGPPFATGMPHYGHILAGTIKDVIPRYFTMQGFRVERRFGWDCHGLPVEYEAEKELGTRGRPDIEKMGIAEFNEYCRSIVLRYSEEWKRIVNRMGRWADLENDYKTMDLDFMESIWWVFKTLWDKGLVYQSLRILPYSARLNTPLSNFEVNQNYRLTQDPSITIRFASLTEENTYFLGWTTTPWTLPSNLAICVHPDLDYVKVKSGGEYFYLCEKALHAYSKKLGEYEIVKTVKGSELDKTPYRPLFPYFSHFADEGAYIVTLGEHVSPETGTGIVHTAPMFGEDDFNIGKLYDLPKLMTVDDSGEFNAEVTDFAGLFFKDADKPIIKYLKDNNSIFLHETIEHSYPFCWRSDTPLMYRAIPSWFVNVEKIKEIMLKNNSGIHYKPEHIRGGRMGKWLENARDWCISRNRFWGSPIPVWICEECDHRVCLGSREELQKYAGREIDDLHRHFIDDIEIPCGECHGKMSRTPEVLDCWFESGSMPYAQEHYPFENKERFDKNFPADFISEGIDQTRGWFYTLSVLSNALFEVPAYKNIIVSGLILAENGEKMSKRLKNYPDPEEMINKYGADAIRLYMLNSGVIKAEDLKFSETGLKETLRNQVIPLFNSLIFFKTYAAIDDWTLSESESKSENPLDIWILSQFNELTAEITAAMNDYDLNRSVHPLVKFIDSLTNWYIRRSRRRFWKEGKGEDKNHAYATLYHVLKGFSRLVAPVIPFSAEKIYQELRMANDPISVHLDYFPKPDQSLINTKLNEDMLTVVSIVGMGRFLRAGKQLKIRQPLSSLSVVSSDPGIRDLVREMELQIAEELNVKKVVIRENEEELVTFSARPNLPALGPRYGKQLKILTEKIRGLKSMEIAGIMQGGSLEFEINGSQVKLNADDILIDRNQKQGMLVETQGSLIVALDTNIDEELLAEGFARELINRIQNARKDKKLEVSDRIALSVCADWELKKKLEKNREYIQKETLAGDFIFTDETQAFSDNLNGIEVSFGINKK